MRRLVTAAVVALASSLGTGCADPYASGPPAPERSTVPGELAAPPVPRPAERLMHLPASPEAAARRAADLTTTWTARTAPERYAALASFSVGPARRDARETAARLPTDPQLDGTRSRGRVAAVVPRAGDDRRRRLLVVTHETVSSDGLTERRWRVTLATVARRPGGWALSRWEPQP